MMGGRGGREDGNRTEDWEGRKGREEEQKEKESIRYNMYNI